MKLWLLLIGTVGGVVLAGISAPDCGDDCVRRRIISGAFAGLVIGLAIDLARGRIKR